MFRLSGQEIEQVVSDLRPDAVNPFELIGARPIDGEDRMVERESLDHDVGGLDECREQVTLGRALRHPAFERGVELAQRSLRAEPLDGGPCPLGKLPDEGEILG